MAQIAIREYDVKRMFANHSGTQYRGVQIKSLDDIKKLDESKRYVIKPDMLFGKRGKRGLVGINLSKSEGVSWLSKYLGKPETIDGIDGTLEVFLAEEMINITHEYYLSFAQSRDGDIITFSSQGGVDIEENWDKTRNIIIPVTQKLTQKLIGSFSQNIKFQKSILELYNFYKSHGFVSLEFNPIAEDSEGNFHLVDAVAKIDDSESYLQKEHWKNIEIPNSYGFLENKGEQYIRELDSQTGASLKFKILNPDAKIWTLFAGGGGSLVMTDSLGALGYADEIGNYGECSGNPSGEFTREYTKTLIKEMLKNQKVGKYLIIAGAIANFTNITHTFQGVIDALEEYQDELKKQKVRLLVRRGGINEKEGLSLLDDACKRLGIPAIITGSESYMTDILHHIKI